MTKDNSSDKKEPFETDFEWQNIPEPHASRRREMMAKYGSQIKKLFTNDIWAIVLILAAISLQMTIAVLLRNATIGTLFLVAYCTGAAISSCLVCANHEISHSTIFGYNRIWANRALGLLNNLPLVFPSFGGTKKYHPMHHRYTGDEEWDVDTPADFEGRYFKGVIGKFVFLLLHLLFMGLRAVLVKKPLPPTRLEKLNLVLQVAFSVCFAYFVGWKSLLYLFLSTWCSFSANVAGMHTIASHFTAEEGVETFSYYGPMNYFTFNIGYHNEHHDFPNIPARHLPKLRLIAPEYYGEHISIRYSWTKMLFEFIFNPRYKVYGRIKRHHKSESDSSPTIDEQGPEV